jgi:hypothetical protein
MAMTQKELGKLCTKAAKVIERDGFLKGDYGSNDGPKCAIGALRYASSDSISFMLDVDGDMLTGLFRATRPHSKRANIVVFNDADRTRKHDVVELLRDMAVRARGAAVPF